MLFTPEQYKSMREGYCYCDRDCTFEIVATTGLEKRFARKYRGIFSKAVPSHYHEGINLRFFELIVQAVFADVNHAETNKCITPNHIGNLREIVCAIVHWKMASQGGRADLKVANVKKKWEDDTLARIMKAYRKKDLSLFKIGGVRIPIATAFLRFIFPDQFGIMDSRVVKITQINNITDLDIRDDGYIVDKKKNTEEYNQKYNSFLSSEAHQLNNLNVLYQDIDEHGIQIHCRFRPCDIEMALF